MFKSYHLGTETDTRTHGHTDRRTDRQTDRQTDTHTHTDMCKTFTYPLSQAVINYMETEQDCVIVVPQYKA